MIVYLCRINHRKTYNNHVYNDDYPLWEKLDNIFKVDITTIYNKLYLRLWKRLDPIGGRSICTSAILAPYNQIDDERVSTIWFNGKSYYLYTDQDLYDCMEDLNIVLNNEELEKVLETV